MKRRSALLTMTVVLGVFLLLAGGTLLNAQEKKVSAERLHGSEIGYEIVSVSDFQGIRPLKIHAKKGTTVIWFNNGRSPLSITFKGEQKVYTACKEPVNFVVGVDGSFVSTWIPNGSTASLCFIEDGMYQYEVAYSAPAIEGTERNTTGSVHIE